MNFKIGDEVKITSGPFEYREGRVVLGEDEYEWKYPLYKIKLFGTNVTVNVLECDLTLIKTKNPKSLLKDGVVATFRSGRSGRKGILYCSDFLNVENDNAQKLSNVDFYDDNLIHDENQDGDIMKLEFDGKVIWERPKEKTFELEYIDELGGHILDEYKYQDDLINFLHHNRHYKIVKIEAK